MGQFADSNEAKVRAVAAPSFFLQTVPELVEVPIGDLDMVARFKVKITRKDGYAKPIYLLVAGTSMGEFKRGEASIMTPDGFGLAGAADNEVDLEMDIAQTTQVGLEIPFIVRGFEDEPVISVAEAKAAVLAKK